MLHLPILYLLPLLPHHHPLILAVLLCLLLPFLLAFSGFLNGMRVVFEPEALNYFTFFLSQLVDLIYIQESNLNSSSSFRIPGFSDLPSDRTHSRSGILSLDVTHASRGVINFVRQGLSFSELSISSLSLFHLHSDYLFFLVNKTSYISELRFSPMVPQIRRHKSLLSYIIELCVLHCKLKFKLDTSLLRA